MTTPNIYPNEPIRASLYNRFGFHVGTWTPRLTAVTTDPVLGNSSEAEGQWMQLGQIMLVWGRFRFGLPTDSPVPSPGSGIYNIHLPTNVTNLFASTGTGVGTVIGTGEIRDHSSVTAGSRKIVLQLADAGDIDTPAQARMYVMDGTSTAVESNVPFTFAAQDAMAFFVSYPTDFLREILLP